MNFRQRRGRARERSVPRRAALARKRINVSVSDAAWTRIDMDARGIPALVRASVHYYNSEEEVDAFAAAVAALLGKSGATPPE